MNRNFFQKHDKISFRKCKKKFMKNNKMSLQNAIENNSKETIHIKLIGLINLKILIFLINLYRLSFINKDIRTMPISTSTKVINSISINFFNFFIIITIPLIINTYMRYIMTRISSSSSMC